MKYKRNIRKRILKTYCIIPKFVQGKRYWFTKCYILQEYKRTFYGSYPNDFYSDQWINIRLCTEREYHVFKNFGELPKSKT